MYKTKLNPVQQLFTASQWNKLLFNSKNNPEGKEDFVPVVKFFNPRGGATWLLTECDEEGYAFGLCDLGMGFPELGSVSMPELCDIGYMERDLYFKPKKTLSAYTEEAREKGRIVA